MLPAEAYVFTSINPWWLDNDKSSAAWHTFAVPTFISTNAALEMWRHIMFNPTGRYMVYWVLTPVAPWFLSLKRNPRELTWSHTPLLLLIFKDPFSVVPSFQETYFCWKHLRSILMYPWHLDIAMVGMWRGWRKKSSIWLWRTVPLNDSTFFLFFFVDLPGKNGQKHLVPDKGDIFLRWKVCLFGA